MSWFLHGVWTYYGDGFCWLVAESRRDPISALHVLGAKRKSCGLLGIPGWAAQMAKEEKERDAADRTDWWWELYGGQLSYYHDHLVKNNRADAEAAGPIFNAEDPPTEAGPLCGKETIELVAIYGTGDRLRERPAFHDLSTGKPVEVRMFDEGNFGMFGGGDVAMAMQKYGSPEKGEVLGEKEHKGIWAKLKKVGKKSVAEMDDEERDKLLKAEDKEEGS